MVRNCAPARQLGARQGRQERGASALEWAIIAAIVVVAATAIGAAIYNIVQNKTAEPGQVRQPAGRVDLLIGG